MTVSDLIKALADFDPSAEVRIKPTIDSRGEKIKRVYGYDGRSIRQGRAVFIERKGWLES